MKRLTKQRLAIVEFLKQAGRPVSIEEILTSASSKKPNINISTIYRNIKILIEEGFVQSVNVPGSCIRFEISEPVHTHHFLCLSCNRLYNIPICPKDIMSMIPPGFKMLNHSITLNGTCRECNHKG